MESSRMSVRLRGAVIACVVALLWSGASAMLVLNLADHCYPPSGGCKSLSADIESCQSNGVKLFLSIGGWPNFSNYSLGSVEDAQNLTNYLWENFLGGQSNSRPLGDVILDDIDFDIRTTTTSSKKVYLSATPECPYPDDHLGVALETALFDYVWIQLYNNPHYLTITNKLYWWNKWTTVNVTTIQTWGLSRGFSTSLRAYANGYITVVVLIFEVLPEIKTSSKYGGVMLWDNYYDKIANYSLIIKESLIMKLFPIDGPTLAAFSE
ncbi:acidic endochitinase-like [Cryptomeria japonica]|uniref:acidic endochitinase-like n=1 Tax=Cryptomeria japonica TaxID=3369 RepID=UPI0027DA556B|nr:acidic endochitinase-like [Cryptomeria japonica]